MKTIILHNIISSNTVYKLNSYIDEHEKQLGEVLVVFCSRTESNRKWKLSEKIKFKYKILKNIRIEFKGNDLFTYFYNPEVFKLLGTYNPDRIIICGWDQFTYQAAFFWGWRHCKHITLWSGSTKDEKSWRRLVSLPLVKFFIRISTDYIAYGTRSKEYMISLGANLKKIKIFMNDVNKKYFITESTKWRKQRTVTEKSLEIPTKHNFIYVGQLIERKGVINLVRTFKEFKKINPEWGLVIVGSGKQEQVIKKMVRSGNIEHIYILGNIEQYELPRVYSVCDCLVLPSLEEVWGLVVNEALCCDLKVIVSDKCGCGPDLVKPGVNGYIFRTDKKDDLLKKMFKIAA